MPLSKAYQALNMIFSFWIKIKSKVLHKLRVKYIIFLPFQICPFQHFKSINPKILTHIF